MKAKSKFRKDLSQWMTFILRHGAKELNIVIRSDGYVLVKDMLKLEDKGKLSKCKIEEVHIRAEVFLNEK